MSRPRVPRKTGTKSYTGFSFADTISARNHAETKEKLPLDRGFECDRLTAPIHINPAQSPRRLRFGGLGGRDASLLPADEHLHGVPAFA
jgi:hypothetical protein